MAEVAGDIGCSTRFIYQLSKRKFPKLVAVVLALALGVNVGNSSGESLSQKLDIDQKGHLPTFTLDEGTPAHPPPLGKTVDLDDKSPPDFDQVRAELMVLYPHRAADLAKLAS